MGVAIGVHATLACAQASAGRSLQRHVFAQVLRGQQLWAAGAWRA